MSRRSTRRAALATTAIAALAIMGCNPPYSSATHTAFVNNPTPTLDGMATRSVDITNDIAITNDTNLRIVQDDLMRFWLIDRPRRTTRFPMAY